MSSKFIEVHLCPRESSIGGHLTASGGKDLWQIGEARQENVGVSPPAEPT